MDLLQLVEKQWDVAWAAHATSQQALQEDAALTLAAKASKYSSIYGVKISIYSLRRMYHHYGIKHKHIVQKKIHLTV